MKMFNKCGMKEFVETQCPSQVEREPGITTVDCRDGQVVQDIPVRCLTSKRSIQNSQGARDFIQEEGLMGKQ